MVWLGGIVWGLSVWWGLSSPECRPDVSGDVMGSSGGRGAAGGAGRVARVSLCGRPLVSVRPYGSGHFTPDLLDRPALLWVECVE